MNVIVTAGLFAFLFGLLFLLILALLSAVFHLRCRVPFVPTPQRVADVMINEARLHPGDVVLDLGAGDGRVLARAMQRVPGIRALGYEGSLVVWILSHLRSLCSRYKPEIRMQNFHSADFSKADAIFTYLGVDSMARSQPKFLKELKPGARLVSHAFTLKGIEPTIVTPVDMPFFGKTMVYTYVWK
jgi:precorrin-6B methylase 2